MENQIVSISEVPLMPNAKVIPFDGEGRGRPAKSCPRGPRGR
jgi:hypothetical protein